MSEKEVDLNKIEKAVSKKITASDEVVNKIAKKIKNQLDMENMSVGEKKTDVNPKQEFEILAKSIYNNKSPKKIAEKNGVSITKDTQETDYSSAGFAVPKPLRDEIIPILDSEPAYLGAGPLIVDMPTGKMDVGRQNQDPTANWQDESASISKSDPAGDTLQLSPHKLTVGVDVSNDYLRREDKILGEDYILDRMMKVAENKLDATLLATGTGTQFQPASLKNLADSGNVFSSTGSPPSITDASGDMKTARNNLDGADVPDNDRAWLMRPEVANYLRFDLNSNEDTFLFQEMLKNGTLFGDPVYTSTNIPQSGNDSDIFYVELSECMVGRSTNFTMESSAHEKFSSDTTVLKLVSHWDQVLMHDKAVSVIENFSTQ